jgi:hypothetical protein
MEKLESEKPLSTFPQPRLLRNTLSHGIRIQGARPVFLRDNAPFELALGNYPGSNGMGWFGKHPTQNKWEYASYKRMGELAYVAHKNQLAMAFVQHSPQEFANLCATRVVRYLTQTPKQPLPTTA